MKLNIKNMVSNRCKMVVKDELSKLGISSACVELGVVETAEELTCEQLRQLKEHLLDAGLELIDDRKQILVEKIKTVIIEMVHHSDDNDEHLKMNFSTYLSEKLKYDYTYLANLFSEMQGITIEHYIINHKIERVKELLAYDEINLTEIAWKLHYSSVSHLSNQFKKVTGLTPSHYKSLKQNLRKPLESV